MDRVLSFLAFTRAILSSRIFLAFLDLSQSRYVEWYNRPYNILTQKFRVKKIYLKKLSWRYCYCFRYLLSYIICGVLITIMNANTYFLFFIEKDSLGDSSRKSLHNLQPTVPRSLDKIVCVRSRGYPVIPFSTGNVNETFCHAKVAVYATRTIIAKQKRARPSLDDGLYRDHER